MLPWFRDDKRLRTAGFSIHERWKDGEPKWIRKGIVYTQSEALELIAEEKQGEEASDG